jgi:hypothetical protein
MLKIPGRVWIRCATAEHLGPRSPTPIATLLTITTASMTNQTKEPYSLQRESMVLC